MEDFSTEHLFERNIARIKQIIEDLNDLRKYYIEFDDETKPHITNATKKDIWWQMIQLLPSSYNQTRNVMLNYEVLCDIYEWRKDHKLDCWIEFCKWIESLPYSELITEPVNNKYKED